MPVTVNREYFASQIFRAIIIFVLNNFWINDPVIFMQLIFALAVLSENILTTNISRFTVLYLEMQV